MFQTTVFLTCCCFAAAQFVETPFGSIKGRRHVTEDGFEADLFLGIPFAKAPIGPLRFEKPVIVEPWNEIIDATNFGPACHPHHRNFSFNKTYSEDCLSVNIFVPTQKTSEKMPVLFYVHGGGFVMGDAEAIGYKMVVDNFVSKDIIFVTIQYRVGFLGFFSSGTNEISGNWGLWDQALALKFVREILPAFGGDIDRITVMGGSAGSASVTSLLVSPHSNGLFSQAIQNSGSAYAEWAYTQNVVKESTVLTYVVGCTMETVKGCMQERTVDELLDGVATIGSARKHASIFPFQPHYDGDFFPEEIEVLLEKAPKKKTIQGVTDQEGLSFTILFPMGKMYIAEDKHTSFMKDDFNKFLQHTFTVDEFGEKVAQSLTDLTVDFYTDGENNHNSSFYIARFSYLIGDYLFNIPVYQEIQQKLTNGWETYSYVIDYLSKTFNDPTGLITGCFHGGEMEYVLEFGDMLQRRSHLSEEDKRFQKNLVGAFVNFIKSGDPSTEDFLWLPATAENRDRSLRLNANPQTEEVYFRHDAADFWLKKLPNAVGSANVRKLLPAYQTKTPRVEL